METSSAVWQHRGSGPDDPEGADLPMPAGDADSEGGVGPTPPLDQRDRGDLWLGRVIAAITALALVVVAYVLHAALPATPFKLPFDNREAVRTVAPEGWGFFTISPRTPDVTVHGLRPDGGWRQLTVGAHGPGTLLGLDRQARSQGTEVGIVANQVLPDEWTECDREPVDCLSALPARPGPVTNNSNYQSICGEVGLVMQDVLPWAWRDLSTVMPSKVVRVVVSC